MTPSENSTTELDGATPELVSAAIEDREPLPGTDGFAGRVVCEERGPVLVRDVLGRRPLFVDRTVEEPIAENAWAFDRRSLADPVAVPAGTVRSDTKTEQCWTLPDPRPADEESAVDRLGDAIETTLGELDAEGLAIAFSGGVDSALVATGAPAAPRYVAGFPESHDVEAAREAAEQMADDRSGRAATDRSGRAATDRSVRVVELDHDDLREAIPPLVRAIGRSNPMDVAIALPLYLVGRAAAADGYDRLALGQGADELFGGYSKHVDPGDDRRIEADTVRGAVRETIRSLPDQLERDVLAIRAAGVEPVTPYLHDRVVEAALRLPDELLVADDRRKVALRRIAADRLPASIAGTDKKALQYGTYVSRELDRLARRAGFKRRMDDHVGQYIRSLCEDR